MNSRTRRSYNLAAATLLVFLLLTGTGCRAAGECVTDEEPFQIASIQPTAGGGVVITWAPTGTNFIFGVLTADNLLATNTLWVGRIGVWGDLGGAMSWTDATANLSSRFFKIVRILPTSTSDWDADGLPDVWEADYGLDPFDPGDVHADSDGDGVDNLTEYLQGRDPTEGATADRDGIVNLLVFTPLE